MRSSLRRVIAPVWLGAVFLALSVAGCGQPVREDRTITWSPEGKAVGFQHGQEGVFIANPNGGQPIKIFQPAKDVLATSTPLWDPAGRRVIFTTARDPNGQPPPRVALFGEQDPAGQVHHQRPVLYTCWLCEAPKGDQAAEPVALFEAACDHVGYVAANLAVRWHPDGNHILHVQQVEGSQHSLFTHDLTTKQSQRILSAAAPALIFDWAPDQAHLVCVLGDPAGNQPSDGIWIGRPDDTKWWHVPESSALAQGQLDSVLERLRATQPAWTPDGLRFAFVSYTPGQLPKQPDRHFLRLGTLASRQVEQLAEAPAPFQDLHWAPDGLRLGVVRGGAVPSLHTVRRGEAISEPISRGTVRRFAGWDATGSHLAYIVPDKIPLFDPKTWAFLLVADPLARDAVRLAAGDGTEPGHEAFSGMRVTFPKWSPREEKLSLWLTFSPTYQSWFSRMLGWSLRPGDPAAVLDLKSGNVSWLAVNPHEKVQVGHYYLLKRDYTQALTWYKEAENGMPPPKQPTPQEFVQNLTSPRDFSFFHYYCLKKLKRDEEARAKLEQFRQTFLPQPPAEQGNAAGQPQAGGENAALAQLWKVADPKGLYAPLLRDLYEAEVFLSLDAAEDGQAFFREELKTAGSDGARLSSAIVLAQILLLEKKYPEYADLVTDTLMPLLLKVWEPRAGGQSGDIFDTQQMLVLVGGLTLLPMYSADFLAGLPAEQLGAITPRWHALGMKAGDDTGRLAVDLFLQAAHKTLGQDDLHRTATERVQRNPAAAQLLPAEGIPEFVKKTRESMQQQR